jgi:hypothetical protein
VIPDTGEASCGAISVCVKSSCVMSLSDFDILSQEK